MAGKGILVAIQSLAKIAEVDSLFHVVAAQFFLCAMQKDRRVMSRFADQPYHPLRLAEGVGADDMAAIGMCLDRGQQPCDFHHRVRVLKDRQAEGRLSHEKIAWHQLERLGGAVRAGLVVTGDDGASPVIFDQHLSAA